LEAQPAIARAIKTALPDFIHLCISISIRSLRLRTANAPAIDTNCRDR
jgi:hypothetical protein